MRYRDQTFALLYINVFSINLIRLPGSRSSPLTCAKSDLQYTQVGLQAGAGEKSTWMTANFVKLHANYNVYYSGVLASSALENYTRQYKTKILNPLYQIPNRVRDLCSKAKG